MDKFYWGNSTSSMQTEGGWNENGKSPSVYDTRSATDTTSDWKVANDNFHSLTEDLDYMQELGMSMYRFQISWSRIIIDGDGKINPQGFEYYDNLVDELLKRNIEPMICLYHFDMPLHLAQEYNGFLSKKVTQAFINFGKIVIDHFKGKVKYWITFNEQNLYAQPGANQIAGVLDNHKESITDIYQISHNIMYAHAVLTKYIHESEAGQIGGMLAYAQAYPATSNPEDIFAVSQFKEFVNNNLLDAYVFGKYSDAFLKYISNNHLNVEMTEEELKAIAEQKNDFLSFSYYRTDTIDASRIPVGIAPNYYLEKGAVHNPYLRENEWHWTIDPLGFRLTLNELYQRYHLPVFPIENGIGLREEWDGVNPIQDDLRIKYHRNHILAMQAAINEDGVPIMGYLGWGLIDILSSSGNMDKRYGVVYVNRTNHDLRDMKRVPKKSFYWLKDVIQSNGKKL